MPNPMMMPGGMFGMVAGAPRKQPEDEEKKRQSYWQGGDKFTGRDALAAGLAAIGDGFSTWANGPSAGGATGMLIGGRGRAIEQAKAAQAAAMEAQQREADLRAAGITPEQGRLLGNNVGSVIANRMKPPEVPAPDAFERTMRGLNIDPASPQGQEILNRRLESMTRDPNDEYVIVPLPDKRTYAGPRSGLPSVFGVSGQRSEGVPTAPVGKTRPLDTQGAQAPLPQMQMNPQAQFYLDEAKKQEMLEEARNYGRGYMQRMGY